MRDNTERTDGFDRAGTAATTRIASLNDIDGYDVAEGEPDIRGWDVKTATGEEVGKVKDLIVDLDAMKVRYLAVELDRKKVGTDDDRQVLVPIGTARLDDSGDDVIIRETAADLRLMPAYDRASFNHTSERDLRAWHGSRAATAGSAAASTKKTGSDEHLFEDQAFWGKRRKGPGQAYLTRSEEELKVGKRAVEAGSVDVRKRVETERVSKQVPVTHEEVTVERRPASAGSASRADVSDGEIRVPLMAEEVVVEKRTVPKEEIVVKKHAVQDTKTVEADVRKERVDIDDRGDVQRRDRA